MLIEKCHNSQRTLAELFNKHRVVIKDDADNNTCKHTEGDTNNDYNNNNNNKDAADNKNMES